MKIKQIEMKNSKINALIYINPCFHFSMLFSTGLSIEVIKFAS